MENVIFVYQTFKATFATFCYIFNHDINPAKDVDMNIIITGTYTAIFNLLVTCCGLVFI